MNEHKKLLSCWHKLEHFSPAVAPKASEKNVELLKEQEDWKIPLKSKEPNKSLEYTVYLGVFDLSVVNDFISMYFKNTEKDENFRNSKICYASLKLDEEGKYINESFGLSTLPWALSQLEQEKIKNNNWEEEFETIKENLKEFLELNFKETITNSKNEIIKVSIIANHSQLLKLQDKIEEICQWSIKPLKEIHVKSDEKYKSKGDNDTKSSADILNSFYIKDLETIISKYDEKTTSKAFQQYLDGCLNKKAIRTDIVKDIEKLKSALIPNNYPDGCWPSAYTLSLMQQFAVNTIFNDLSDGNGEGLFSVNGPPGTGKTTLLRDIIAPIFVKRAKELIKIENPANAFEKVGSLKINENYSPFLYKPIKTITNGGIVIASSNNGAVENISKELPLKKEVSELYSTDISYFKTVAENCIDNGNWGLFSAVLGNKSNRNDLISSLWFKKDFKNLQNTLKEDKIIGNHQWVEIRTTFNNKINEISLEKRRLTFFKNNCEEYKKQTESLLVITEGLEKTSKIIEKLKIEFENKKIIVSTLNENKKDSLKELVIIKNSKPNFILYWFNKNKRNLYKKALESALINYNLITENLNIENPVLLKIETGLKSTELLKTEQIKDKLNLSNQVEKLSICTEKAKLELKNNYADTDFWKNIESKESQESCP